MRSNFVIVCLLCLNLMAYGVETDHDFDAATKNSTLTWSQNGAPNDYHVGYMSDGTVYTCSGGNNTFAAANLGGGLATICIQLKPSGYVVVSPAKEGLKTIQIVHSPSAVNLAVSVSTDGNAPWTSVSELGTANSSIDDKNFGSIDITGLSGDYFIKITNNAATDAYITEMYYFTNPVSCPNCFPYVP